MQLKEHKEILYRTEYTTEEKEEHDIFFFFDVLRIPLSCFTTSGPALRITQCIGFILRDKGLRKLDIFLIVKGRDI